MANEPKNDFVDVYYLGHPNYSPNGTSFKGLGADCRETYYVPKMECGLLRNDNDEFWFISPTTRIGREIKRLYRIRLREKESIRPMTKEEKEWESANYRNWNGKDNTEDYLNWVLREGRVYCPEGNTQFIPLKGGKLPSYAELQIDRSVLLRLQDICKQRTDLDKIFKEMDKKLGKTLEARVE